jgi:hypothetical protein
MALSHAIDDICQVGLWIEAVKLRGFEHGVQDGRSLASSIRAQEEKILSGQGKTS